MQAGQEHARTGLWQRYILRTLRKMCPLVQGGLLVTAVIGASLLALSNIKPAVADYHGQQLYLDQYQLQADPITLTGVAKNASGLTYNPDTDTLFAIVNNPTCIIELDKSGKVLRHIDLQGFQDTEGITYLGNNRFAVIEERRRQLVFIDIGETTSAIAREGLKSFGLALSDEPNKGFEGIAFDSAEGSLYVVNEKSPRQLLKIDGLFSEKRQSIAISSPWSLEDRPFGCRDFAGLHFDAASGHLMMLSDDSKQLVEVTADGQAISYLPLNSGHAGLDSSIPDPEGVTMDAEGNLFILSEPNLLYRLSRVQG